MPSSPKIDTKSLADKRIVTEDFATLCRQRLASAQIGEMTWQEAIDSMQAYAFTRDIIEAIGQDRVQELMAQAMLLSRVLP